MPLDDSDLLLGRMSVNFGHCSEEQLDDLLKEAETAGKPLADVLVEKSLVTQQQLETMLTIQGNKTGQLVRRQLDEEERLLARMAVSFGHCSKAVMDEVVDEAEESGVPLGDMLLSKGAITEAQLQMVLSFTGGATADTGVREEEARAESRTMFCAYCDIEIEIDEYVGHQTYQCEKCGAVLVKEKPLKPRDRREEKPEPQLTAMYCAICDMTREIESYDPAQTYRCHSCQAVLVTDDDFKPEETEEVPLLEQIGVDGAEPVTFKKPAEEMAEKKAAEKRGNLLLTRANELIRAGNPEQALQDLGAICGGQYAPPEAFLLRARTALELSDHDLVLADCADLLKKREYISEAYELQGRVQMLLDNQRKAMSELDMAIAEDAENIAAWLLRGGCNHKLRKLTQARQDFEKGLALTDGREDLPNDVLRMVAQAQGFIETGKLDDFSITASQPAVEAEAEGAAAASEDQYVSAREAKIDGNLDRAKELFTQLLETDPPTGRIAEAASENEFPEATIYRDLVCHEALADIVQSRGEFAVAARHLDQAAQAIEKADLQKERGSDNALKASQLWSQVGNTGESNDSFSLASRLMGWPDLSLEAWVEELPRDNATGTLKLKVTNKGEGMARSVRLQPGEYLKFSRECRFEEINGGDTTEGEVEFKPARRGKDLKSEFKLFFRDAGSDRQLTRIFGFEFDVAPSYDPPTPGLWYWAGGETAPAPAAAAPAPSGEAVSGLEERVAALETLVSGLSEKLDRLLTELGEFSD